MPTEHLIDGHRRFREKFESEHEVFGRLAEEGQHPKVLWIGCSDSRVVPELITGADPGELFDVRNIANIVPPGPTIACATGAAIEYAVIHLRVSHIVVCGHTDCGGIRALETPPATETEPHFATWLELVRPARERVVARGVAAGEVHIETVRTNILMQCDNLQSYPCVVEREKSGSLTIHAWLYDVFTGLITEFNPESGLWQNVAQAT
jgi:carbonic anhydrase